MPTLRYDTSMQSLPTWFVMTGRERELAAAELTSLTAADSVNFGRDFAIGVGSPPDFDRLGSAIRAGSILGIVQSSDPQSLATEIAQLLSLNGATSKVTLGLSTNCLPPHALKKLGLSLKKVLSKTQGVSLRMVFPATGTILNAGHIQGGKLLQAPNAELAIFRIGTVTYLGQSNWQQDIASYTMRDRERPARDARVGMLPPKLAQMMLNLAGVQKGDTVHDLFCGTGVILTEALRIQAIPTGSDASADMVAASRTNLEWMAHKLQLTNYQPHIWKADAQSVQLPDGVSHIVSEGYLGNPHLQEMSVTRLEAEARTLLPLYRDVLRHLKHYPHPLTIVLAIPAWHHPARQTPIELPIIDVATDMGYTVKQFAPENESALHYHRPHQTVGRMIIKLNKD